MTGKPGPCVLRRLAAKVTLADAGCWQWNGADNGHGYGCIDLGGRITYTHRLAYEAFFGPIPEGYDIDHLCRNRRCCNPFHLEAVTRRENLMRGETLTRAHLLGVDCGFAACPSCQRHRRDTRTPAAVTR